MITNGEIKNTNKSILEQIGEFYITNKSLAREITDEILSYIKTEKNIGIWYANELIAAKNSTPIETAKNIEVERQTISGLQAGNDTTGFAARAFLSSDTQTKYFYFGGYIGDGNISAEIEYNENITDAKIEIAANKDFDIYINNHYAGHYENASSDFVPAIYDLNSYLGYFQSGSNIIEFTGNNLHIAGGYVKISYNGFASSEQEIKYYLPGINGLINLYDGLYIPSELNSLNAYLHFKTNYSVFLNIGNITILEQGDYAKGQEQTIFLDNNYLQSKLNYADITSKTVPIRFGTENITTESILDIALVTDRSGSMRQSGWTLDTSIQPSHEFNNVNVPGGSYSSSHTFNVPAGTERVAIAINWDRIFEYPGSEGSEFKLNLRRPNGVWIFGTGPPDTGGKVDPPDSVGANNEYFSGICTKPQIVYIENPQAGNWQVKVYGHNLRPKNNPPPSQNVNISVYQGTAEEIIKNPTILSIEAAKDASKNFINNMQDTDRSAYVPFGSYAPNNFPFQELTFNKDDLENAIDGTGLQGGTAIQTGINKGKDELVNNARENATKIMIILTDGQNDAGPDIAIQSAQQAKNQDIIIFTIGLTGFVNQEMLTEIASQPDYYYYTPDASGLENVYEQISQKISAIYREQTLISEEFETTILYPDSYIKINYNESQTAIQGIILTLEKQFDNASIGTFKIPQDSTIVSAKAISYSGPRWTNSVSINGNNIYRLNEYGNDYIELGDPYAITIPTQFLQENNTVEISTALSPTNSSEGSKHNKIIYQIQKNSSSYSSICPYISGCTWHIEFEDGTNTTINIPSNYSEGIQCYYTSTTQNYDANDALQEAVYKLLKILDINQNDKVDTKLSENNLQITPNEIEGIPFTWSTEIQIRIWD